MATRTALLNWNVINRDCDFSKHIEAVSEPWVINWLAVTSSSVAVWKAFVKCERANGDVIYALVYNSSAQSISWDWDVYIEVSQEIIDNGELWNEDWTGIADIKVWTLPSKNALWLATISSWVVTDKRNMIKKVGELLEMINANIADIEDLDERVEHLEELDAIDHLEESWIAGELYTLNDTLFNQNAPTYSNSSWDVNIGDVEANTQIHIQAMWSGTASNQLKLKLKMVWSSTQNLTVEVRKWVQVTVTADREAYRYWDEVVASWSVPYTSIGSSYSEITVTLDSDFWWTKGELLDVVLYIDTVNASNYYCVACDSTQYSEWFGYVAVNWTTRERTKLMPYLLSNWFLDSLLVKVDNKVVIPNNTTVVNDTNTYTHTGDSSPSTILTYKNETWVDLKIYSLSCQAYESTYTAHGYIYTYIDGTLIGTTRVDNEMPYQSKGLLYNIVLKNWQTLKVEILGWQNRTITVKDIQLVFSSRLKNNTTSISWKPNDIKSLWNLATMTIFGVLWWEAFLWVETTEHTTWYITPWNCVWFLQIWKYKIPYYL